MAVFSLTGSNNVELHFKTAFDYDLPNHACRRLVLKILLIDAIEDVVLEAAVDKRMHLHKAIKAGSVPLQENLEVLKNAMSFARDGPVLSLARRRINRHHARAEYEASSPNGCRLRIPIRFREVQAGRDRI
jgi:hypothetical protein